MLLVFFFRGSRSLGVSRDPPFGFFFSPQPFFQFASMLQNMYHHTLSQPLSSSNPLCRFFLDLCSNFPEFSPFPTDPQCLVPTRLFFHLMLFWRLFFLSSLHFFFFVPRLLPRRPQFPPHADSHSGTSSPSSPFAWAPLQLPLLC